MKKQELIDLLGGTTSKAAKRLGYTGWRADNNVSRLPDTLTERQSRVIIMRLKAKRIKYPNEWNPIKSVDH